MSDYATSVLVWFECSKSGNHKRSTFNLQTLLVSFDGYASDLEKLNRFHFTGTWGVFTSGTWIQIWARLDIGLVSVNTIRPKINLGLVRQFDPCGGRLDGLVGNSLYLYLRVRFECDSAQTKHACRPIKTFSCLFSPESVASQKQEPLWFSELSR